MKTRYKVSLVLLGAATAFFTSAGIADAASSSNVAPAVVAGNQQFYTPTQVDAAWREATNAIAAPLPAGESYPATAPKFFHPANKPKVLFESNLPAEFAAQYWRCSWLAVGTSPSRVGALSDSAKAQLNDNLKWSKFAGLPGIKTRFDTAGYQSAVDAYAKRHGATAELAEYAVDCGWFESSGGAK